MRETHIRFLCEHIIKDVCLSEKMDSTRSWFFYWILQSLDILGAHVKPHSKLSSWIINTLATLQHPDGGFSGNSHLFPHVIPTFACVHALALLESEEALDIINLPKLYAFLSSLHSTKDASGSQNENFSQDGKYFSEETYSSEGDCRSTYCALTTASLCQLLDPLLVENVGFYLSRCQNYDGGMGGEFGNESHGGYVSCGLASMLIVGGMDGQEGTCYLPSIKGSEEERKSAASFFLDSQALLWWLSQQQMSCEGGFAGRTGKLVDVCYSWWQGNSCWNAMLISQLLAEKEWLNLKQLKENRKDTKKIDLNELEQADSFKEMKTCNVEEACFPSFLSICRSNEMKSLITAQQKARIEREKDGTDADTGIQAWSTCSSTEDDFEENHKKKNQDLLSTEEVYVSSSTSEKQVQQKKAKNSSLITELSTEQLEHSEGNEEEGDVGGDDEEDECNILLEDIFEKEKKKASANDLTNISFEDSSSKNANCNKEEEEDRSRYSSCVHASFYSPYAKVASPIFYDNKQYDTTKCQDFFESPPSLLPLFSPSALLSYGCCCCQDTFGGLKDKPWSPVDCHHTCYALCGLSLAQHAADEGSLQRCEVTMKQQFSLFEPSFPLSSSSGKGTGSQFTRHSRPMIEEISSADSESQGIDDTSGKNDFDLSKETVESLLSMLIIDGLDNDNFVETEEPVRFPHDFDYLPLQPVDPIHGIHPRKVLFAQRFFKEKLKRLAAEKEK
eukprot:MONOS_6194.1-p1 / transcript=MONOS_6194.1 / gene=MONOS_6194 / organism=Monocercomonoides_exilis_PA203 / gene_product=Prenyltransferase squalene oxidase domain containing protein / transcript_product=Prenyltransferase squalene oxidase domain containing protein / location=Mono_scaffold00192:16171-18413(-) / protein_length=730 / sequence_SO=supercontig / SO=protein_coding / is_pseudo=false